MKDRLRAAFFLRGETMGFAGVAFLILSIVFFVYWLGGRLKAGMDEAKSPDQLSGWQWFFIVLWMAAIVAVIRRSFE